MVDVINNPAALTTDVFPSASINLSLKTYHHLLGNTAVSAFLFYRNLDGLSIYKNNP
jgi:hypothetical protein